MQFSAIHITYDGGFGNISDPMVPWGGGDELRDPPTWIFGKPRDPEMPHPPKAGGAGMGWVNTSPRCPRPRSALPSLRDATGLNGLGCLGPKACRTADSPQTPRCTRGREIPPCLCVASVCVGGAWPTRRLRVTIWGGGMERILPLPPWQHALRLVAGKGGFHPRWGTTCKHRRAPPDIGHHPQVLEGSARHRDHP